MKLKVYGFNLLFVAGKQYRGIVATHNQKEAAKLFDVSLFMLREYGCVTGNEEEIKLAMKKPNVVHLLEM